MPRYVVDASVAAKWYFDEEHSALAPASSSSAKRSGCPAKKRRCTYCSAGGVFFVLAMAQSSGGMSACRCGCASNSAFR